MAKQMSSQANRSSGPQSHGGNRWRRWAKPTGMYLVVLIYFLIAYIQCLPTPVFSKSTGDDPGITVKTVERICANSKVRIKTIDDMLKVIRLAAANRELCGLRYLPALNELEPILLTKPEKLCSSETIDLVTNYHFRFIQPKEQVNKRVKQYEKAPVRVVKGQLHPEPRKYTVEFDEFDEAIQAPTAVRHFFLAYALQLSYTCKRVLALNLPPDAKRIIEEDERDIMVMFDKSSPIGMALAESVSEFNFDNVVYLPQLDGKLRNLDGEEMGTEHKQHMQTTATDQSSVFVLIRACKNKFWPLYEKLIWPIVVLSKLGYDYQGPMFDANEKEFLAGNELQTWLGIVNACQTVVSDLVIHTIKEPAVCTAQSNSATTAGGNEDQSKDELLSEGTLVPVDSPPPSASETNSAPIEDEKPLAYEVSRFSLMDNELKIVGRDQLDLELSRKKGHRDPFGVRGILRRAMAGIRKALASLDMERFAHYRRNSAWYAGALNLVSSCSNIASITVTIMSTIGCPLGR